MKLISFLFLCLYSIQVTLGQDTLKNSPSFSLRPSEEDPKAIHFHFHLTYDSIPEITVYPYYALFKSEGEFIEDSIVSIKPHSKQLNQRAYWFNYSPSVQANYIDMAGLADTGPTGNYLPFPKIELQCSKIINSKGEDVYIYYTTVLGIVEYETQNPCVAFEGMNHYNTKNGYWSTREFLYRTSNVGLYVKGMDLPKGTYLFNWYNENDPLNIIIKQLWNLKAQYDLDRQKIDYQTEDSLRNLYRATLNQDYLNAANKKRTESYNEWIYIKDKYAHGIKELYQDIYDLGYGINEGKYFFSIYQKALLTHKLSEKLVSPEVLQQYIVDSEMMGPKEVQEILSVFTMFNPYTIK